MRPEGSSVLEGSEPSEEPGAGEDCASEGITRGIQGGEVPGTGTQVGIHPFSEIRRLDSPEATSSLGSSFDS